MRSTKCVECGFVGWSDQNCKACGAPPTQRSTNLPRLIPVYTAGSLDQRKGKKKGLAIFALVVGIVSLFTFGLLGVGAITGIILAAVAMRRVKREPWKYGGRGMAIAGLILSITSLATFPVALVAAIERVTCYPRGCK